MPSAASDRIDRQELAVAAATRLLRAYRKVEAADPDGFADALTQVLAKYSPAVVAEVTDPAYPRWPWAPNHYELDQACRDVEARIVRAEKARREAAACLAERREYEERRRTAPTRAELEDKLGRAIGERGAKRNSADVGERLKAEHGISDAQWAEIPDAIHDSPRRTP